MNTADRSLTLIDSALRRRFVFEEMMPDYDLLKKEVGFVQGVNIGEMLKAINKRIAKNYDREHQIGHSFFLGLGENSTITDLREIFQTKILPLLEEYFYDEREKIKKDILNENAFYNGDGELDKDKLGVPAEYIKIYP
jgi:5-methylcytosine-specific restriction protein B